MFGLRLSQFRIMLKRAAKRRWMASARCCLLRKPQLLKGKPHVRGMYVQHIRRIYYEYASIDQSCPSPVHLPQLLKLVRHSQNRRIFRALHSVPLKRRDPLENVLNSGRLVISASNSQASAKDNTEKKRARKVNSKRKRVRTVCPGSGC